MSEQVQKIYCRLLKRSLDEITKIVEINNHWIGIIRKNGTVLETVEPFLDAYGNRVSLVPRKPLTIDVTTSEDLII